MVAAVHSYPIHRYSVRPSSITPTQQARFQERFMNMELDSQSVHDAVCSPAGLLCSGIASTSCLTHLRPPSPPHANCRHNAPGSVAGVLTFHCFIIPVSHGYVTNLSQYTTVLTRAL